MAGTSALEREGGGGRGWSIMNTLRSLEEPGRRLGAVTRPGPDGEVKGVMRWPGPYMIEREGRGGAGDVARVSALAWRGGRWWL